MCFTIMETHYISTVYFRHHPVIKSAGELYFFNDKKNFYSNTTDAMRNNLRDSDRNATKLSNESVRYSPEQILENLDNALPDNPEGRASKNVFLLIFLFLFLRKPARPTGKMLHNCAFPV